MAGPWEAYAAPAPAPAGPWQAFGRSTRTASGVLDALQAGYQGGATGLILRRELPDVVLDPVHAKWYEKAAAGIAQVVTEIPEMAVGGMIGLPLGTAAGGAAGSVVPGVGNAAGAVAGGLMGTGAGAFAVPAAIRTALIEAYKSGTADSSGGFLASTKIVLKHTGKEGLIGALTFGAGGLAGRVVGSAVAPAVGSSITARTGSALIEGAAATAELGTMVVTPAALEGKLPEWEDFLNAAIVLGGVKVSVRVAEKIGDIYARTGVPPEEVVAAARQDPRIAEELRSPDAEIPSQFKPLSEAEAARNAVLDPAAAREFVAKPFAEVPQAPGTPKVDLHVNYDYINSPAEAKAALARASELYEGKIIEQTRGEVGWAATEAEARQRLSELTGVDVTKILGEREPGTASNAADLLLRRQLLEGAVEDFTRRAREYDAAKSSPEQAIQMLAAAERVAMLSAQFQGAASEAGRALNILKNARETARSAEEVKKLLETYDRDPAQIAAVMRMAENPVQAAAAARAIVKAGPWEKIVEGMKAWMISGPVTISANVVGNTTFLPLRPVIDAVAAPISALRGGPASERVTIAEPVVRVVGYFQGMVDALVLAGHFLQHYGPRPAMEGLRVIDAMGGRKTESQKRAIEGDLGVIIRSPFMALSIPDALFRMMIERGEASTLAARQAVREGYGLTSREFRERMVTIRQNLTPEQTKQVEAMGERGTFNADLGRVGRTAQQLVKAMHAEPIFPFIRTPANIAKELLRLTPMAPIIDKWRADVAAGGAKADKALAEMVVGSGIAFMVMGLAQAGKLTGAGEPDHDKRRVKLAAGEQPYSYITDSGKAYEYSRLQPLGTLVGLAVDTSEIWDKMTPEEQDKVPRMIAVAFANAITNQTMLMGLTNLVRAISEPDRFGEKFAQNLAGMVVPGAVAQTSALTDPYMREIHSIVDAIKIRTPARDSLQPKIDVFGEMIENRERVGVIGPVRTMEHSKDKVRTEAARLNFSAPKTPESIQLPGAKGDRKLASVELTPEQQTQYAITAGQTAHRFLAPLVNAADWDARPDMEKKLIYSAVFERARTFARNTVLPMEQRELEARRIADEVTRRMTP